MEQTVRQISPPVYILIYLIFHFKTNTTIFGEKLIIEKQYEYI